MASPTKTTKEKLTKENINKYILYCSSNQQDIQEAITEWQVVNVLSPSDTVHSCICGAKPTCFYHLVNVINKNILYVGMECLKYFKHVKDFATILRKQHDYRLVGKDQFRLCHGCVDFNINMGEPDWKTICKNCYIDGIRTAPIIPLLDHRVCEDCFVPSISPSLPLYRTKCAACFKKAKETEEPVPMKPCEQCGKMTVKQADKFRKLCFVCYKNSK